MLCNWPNMERMEETSKLLKDYDKSDELFSQPGVSVVRGVKQLHHVCGAVKKLFKIGVAHDVLKRWWGYTDRNGKYVPPLMRDFKALHVAVVQNNFEASAAEKELIGTWSSSRLCLNVTKGGDNINMQEVTSPYFVYVACKG